MTDWIPVTERLPDKGIDVLVYRPRFGLMSIAWLRDDGRWDHGEAAFNGVTHWQPLPTLPDEKEVL